jgi:hypothetical protein
MLLRADPSLLSKCVSSINLPSWEAQPSIPFLCALSQLTYLNCTVDVDDDARTAIRNATRTETAKADALLRGAVNTSLQAMIPIGEWSRGVALASDELTLPFLI